MLYCSLGAGDQVNLEVACNSEESKKFAIALTQFPIILDATFAKV